MRTRGSQAKECLQSCHGRLSAAETEDKFIEIILHRHRDECHSARFADCRRSNECVGRGFRDAGTHNDTLSLRFWNTLSIDRYQLLFTNLSQGDQHKHLLFCRYARLRDCSPLIMSINGLTCPGGAVSWHILAPGVGCERDDQALFLCLTQSRRTHKFALACHLWAQ